MIWDGGGSAWSLVFESNIDIHEEAPLDVVS